MSDDIDAKAVLFRPLNSFMARLSKDQIKLTHIESHPDYGMVCFEDGTQGTPTDTLRLASCRLLESQNLLRQCSAVEAMGERPKEEPKRPRSLQVERGAAWGSF